MVAAAPTRRTGLLLLLGSLGWPSFPLARLGFAGQLVHVTAREGACLPILATASRPSHSYGCHCHITHLPLPRTCPQAPFPAGAFRVRHRHFWFMGEHGGMVCHGIVPTSSTAVLIAIRQVMDKDKASRC